MAKSRKNKNRKHSQDVTVNDFANAAVSNFRLKKSTNTVSSVVKNELEVKDNWDDEISEDEIVKSDKTRRRRKQSSTSTSKNECGMSGNDYPYDIWFLISTYIRPEDVGTFASICKTSLNVVSNVQFWVLLYKRYYKKENLPEEFKECFLMRCCGLRTFVIKALYRMYPPFIAHSKTVSGGIRHPDVLEGRKCIAISLKKEGKNWCYYFKFDLNNPTPFFRSKPQNIIELLNDIHANPDENNCILKIVSSESIAMVPVLGQTLKRASIALSKGLCSDKVQLVFSSEISCNNRSRMINGEVVVIDRVSKICIFNWWHPNYLSNNKIPILDHNDS